MSSEDIFYARYSVCIESVNKLTYYAQNNTRWKIYHSTCQFKISRIIFPQNAISRDNCEEISRNLADILGDMKLYKILVNYAYAVELPYIHGARRSTKTSTKTSVQSLQKECTDFVNALLRDENSDINDKNRHKLVVFTKLPPMEAMLTGWRPINEFLLQSNKTFLKWNSIKEELILYLPKIEEYLQLQRAYMIIKDNTDFLERYSSQKICHI